MSRCPQLPCSTCLSLLELASWDVTLPPGIREKYTQLVGLNSWLVRQQLSFLSSINDFIWMDSQSGNTMWAYAFLNHTAPPTQWAWLMLALPRLPPPSLSAPACLVSPAQTLAPSCPSLLAEWRPYREAEPPIPGTRCYQCFLWLRHRL